jgi:Undecaprenyl-phosphate glucose phosphotransferase
LGAIVHIARLSVFASGPARGGMRLPRQALSPIAAAVDAVLLIAASVMGTVSYQFFLTGQPTPLGGSIGPGLMAAAVFILLARSQGLYRLQVLVTPVPHLPRYMVVVAVSLLALICVFFLLKVGADYSRGAMILFAGIALALAPAGRILVGVASREGIRRGAVRGRRAVTLGDAAEMARLDAADFLQFGIDEVARFALFDGSSDGRVSGADRARVAQAIEAARQFRALEFALVVPWSRDRELSEVTDLLRASPLPVRLYPDNTIRAVIRRREEPGFDQYFSVKIQREPLNARERALKRMLDIAIAGSALIVLSPLLLLACLLIRLDSPGPIIFRQRRCGFDNREFVIFKFRTMRVFEDKGAIVQAKRSDDRVTPIGAILRRASMDELPQLLNVIRGDMSLVGPRPHAIFHDDEYKARISDYALRHRVKPGLTGAAQVAGLRGETQRIEQMERRVERDLWYINNWSLALDLKIMAQTCVALIRGDAY